MKVSSHLIIGWGVMMSLLLVYRKRIMRKVGL